MNTETLSTETVAEEAGDPGALELWAALARAYSAIEERAAADAARHGLTLAEFAVLEALYHTGAMQLGELQRKILVSSGGMTYLVDKLEADDLVRREPDPDDRRARFVELTSRGRRFIKRAFPEHARVLGEALSGLGARDQRRATELLARLAK